VLFDRDLAVRIHVIQALGGIERVKLSIHAQAISHRVELLYDGTFLLQARLDHTALAKADRDFGITLEDIETVRPIDLGPSGDRRWLGIAIAWCEIEPA
jgi:hypothetical protein